MKKILFLLIGIIGLGLNNFSSANDYTFVGDNEEYEYTPSTITFSNSFTLSEDSVVSFEGTDCFFNISIYEDTNHGSYCSIYAGYDSVSVEELSDGDCDLQSGVTYNVFSQDLLFSSITITDGVLSGGGSNSGSGVICDCPVCESTFSTLFVNGTQITGSSNIYISIPDHFVYTPTYYTGYMDLDIENEGNSEYIQNILDIQSYHPDKDQFAMSFSGFLTLLMPYIIITLFIIFVWKLIRRIFR